MIGNAMTFAAQEKSTAETDRLESGFREFGILDATFSIGGLQDRFFVLLQAVDDLGSLVAAAKRAGLSYKGAWDMIERASLLSPRPLIDRNPGGGVDRGTRLTETGRCLLDIHGRLETRKRKILQELNRELSIDPILLQWYRRLLLKSSTRNQWRAEVISVKMGVVKNEVQAQLSGGSSLIANVSRQSIVQMQLEFGSKVIAMVKTPMINLLTDTAGYCISAENQFEGSVEHIVRDSFSAEVIVRLASGERVITAVSDECLSEQGLDVGAQVMVCFDAESVILASVPH